MQFSLISFLRRILCHIHSINQIMKLQALEEKRGFSGFKNFPGPRIGKNYFKIRDVFQGFTRSTNPEKHTDKDRLIFSQHFERLTAGRFTAGTIPQDKIVNQISVKATTVSLFNKIHNSQLVDHDIFLKALWKTDAIIFFFSVFRKNK